jgi:hypothetical protein
MDMEVLLLLVMGVVNVLCFVIGAKVGQAVSKDKEIELPSVNPLEAWREEKAKREAEKEQNKIDVIMQNIENYDGTGANQKDVP